MVIVMRTLLRGNLIGKRRRRIFRAGRSTIAMQQTANDRACGRNAVLADAHRNAARNRRRQRGISYCVSGFNFNLDRREAASFV